MKRRRLDIALIFFCLTDFALADWQAGAQKRPAAKLLPKPKGSPKPKASPKPKGSPKPKATPKTKRSPKPKVSPKKSPKGTKGGPSSSEGFQHESAEGAAGSEQDADGAHPVLKRPAANPRKRPAAAASSLTGDVSGHESCDTGCWCCCCFAVILALFLNVVVDSFWEVGKSALCITTRTRTFGASRSMARRRSKSAESIWIRKNPKKRAPKAQFLSLVLS